MTSAEIVAGLDGAAKEFNRLSVDFSGNPRITPNEEMETGYALNVDENKDKFLTVYNAYVKRTHVVRLTFGPSDIWGTVKQTL